MEAIPGGGPSPGRTLGSLAVPGRLLELRGNAQSR